MNVSLFKKSMAYLLDITPIFFALMILNTLFVGEMLKDPYPNYDAEYEVYQENVDAYYVTLEIYTKELDDEVITQTIFDTKTEDLMDAFQVVNEDTESMIFNYFRNVLYFFLIGFVIIKYIYNLVTKGQTFGLKLMKLELVGRINWFTLLLREVFWREVFWVLSVGIGLLIDLILLTFTKKSKTLRDMFSETQVIHQGTSYPF